MEERQFELLHATLRHATPVPGKERLEEAHFHVIQVHCEHNSLTSGLPLMLSLTFGYGHHKVTTHTLTAASHSSYLAAASLRCFSVCPTRPRQPRATAVRPGAEWVGERTLPAGYGHSAKAPRSVHTWYPNGLHVTVFDQVTRQLIQPVPGRPIQPCQKPRRILQVTFNRFTH